MTRAARAADRPATSSRVASASKNAGPRSTAGDAAARARATVASAARRGPPSGRARARTRPRPNRAWRSWMPASSAEQPLLQVLGPLRVGRAARAAPPARRRRRRCGRRAGRARPSGRGRRRRAPRGRCARCGRGGTPRPRSGTRDRRRCPRCRAGGRAPGGGRGRSSAQARGGRSRPTATTANGRRRRRARRASRRPTRRRPGRRPGLAPTASREQRGASGRDRGRGRQMRFVADLPGSDADRHLDRLDPELAVADLAGPGRVDDRVGDLLGVAVGAEHLDAHLGQEVDLVLAAAVHLGVAALATVTRGSR